jgi:4'-phosphopantetheinyl transferase
VAAVDLWCWFTAGLDPDAVEALAAGLSHDERARATRFMRAHDRRDYVAAHALVRHALSQRVPCGPRDWVFSAGAHGKPCVAPPAPGLTPPAFNLSHATGLVACVVAGSDTGVQAVGVDVEGLASRKYAEVIARERFAPEEATDLAALDDAARVARFIDLWTLREAYVKGTGTGLWGPAVPALRFSFDGPSGLQCHRSAGAASWTFALLAPSGYRMAVAVELPSAAAGRWTLALNVVGDVEQGFGPMRAMAGLSCEEARAHAAGSVARAG